ncbi:protein kinase domain-containing protein [Thaumasiovibrio subtropicus]|uniref:protein kinase domain-containing protein n=1 Tax=Thaumasiovibrio subtropicus TaxID=1891207 RepID=UPI000B34BCF9|nr:hypothetical protein [Thaumasiovibrio subtropicus]
MMTDIVESESYALSTAFTPDWIGNYQVKGLFHSSSHSHTWLATSAIDATPTLLKTGLHIEREFAALKACQGRGVQELAGSLVVVANDTYLPLQYYPKQRSLLTLRNDEVSLFIELLPSLIRAITHCHRCGWVHGDIKPSNVLLCDACRQVRLVDFGAALPIGFDRLSLGEWQATPAFASAQQSLGHGFANEGDDWFSLKHWLNQLENDHVPKESREQLRRCIDYLKVQ